MMHGYNHPPARSESDGRVSAGIVMGEALLDLDYDEDSRAGVACQFLCSLPADCWRNLIGYGGRPPVQQRTAAVAARSVISRRMRKLFGTTEKHSWRSIE
jgi:hypothetical protein